MLFLQNRVNFVVSMFQYCFDFVQFLQNTVLQNDELRYYCIIKLQIYVSDRLSNQ